MSGNFVIDRTGTRSQTGTEIIRQFTPNWFTVCMGTGILALALNQAPFATPALQWLCQLLWFLNAALFLLFSGLYAARWILFPREAGRIFAHSVMSMFFGAIPMALATIINGFLAFGIPLWGHAAVTAATFLWWLDAALAITSGIAVPFMMFTRQDHSIEKMTAVWLLPVVAAEVAAASAALVLPHLSQAGAQFAMLISGYLLWAFSVPLAMGILVILLLRLVLHKLPQRDMAASGWLALGPLGTGALGLLLLGADARAMTLPADLSFLGPVAEGAGLIGGALLLGYGAWWLMLAILTTARYLRHGMPFNLGWWGFTFPLGVYAVATLTLGRQLHLGFITAVGSGLVVVLTIFWLIVALRTLSGILQGGLFISPCLVRGAIPGELEADFV